VSRPIVLQTVQAGEVVSTRSTTVGLADRVPADATPHLQDQRLAATQDQRLAATQDQRLAATQDQRLAATYDSADIGIAEVNADGKLEIGRAHV
jgi:hypothetical protein